MWTIGREREKQHAAKFVKEESQQRLLFPVIDVVHDLKEGTATAQDLMNVARVAMVEGGSGVWQNTANWLRQVQHELPEVRFLWSDLAHHPNWQVRWRVACCLYLDIPEQQSDRLFSALRFDKSKRVRATAIDRYEYRPDKRGKVERRFDAADFKG